VTGDVLSFTMVSTLVDSAAFVLDSICSVLDVDSAPAYVVDSTWPRLEEVAASSSEILVVGTSLVDSAEVMTSGVEAYGATRQSRTDSINGTTDFQHSGTA
jgi:hypothetical protein